VKITEYGDVPNGVFVGTFWYNHLELDNDIVSGCTLVGTKKSKFSKQ
jgi:hypothetical protein